MARRQQEPLFAAPAQLNESAIAQAAAMNRMYAWQRPIYNLTRRYYLIGRDKLIEGLQPPDGSVVLEVGCGTARNLVAIGKRYPQARLVGLDISDVMLEEAAKAMRRAGFGYRTRLVKADAAHFDAKRLFHPTPIDRIVMSYTLSMIPQWRAALETAFAMLPTAGEVHIVDFGRMDHLPAFLRWPLRRWLSGFSVTPRDDLEAEIAQLAEAMGLVWSKQSLRGGYAEIFIIRRD